MTDRFRRLLAARNWELGEDTSANVAVVGEKQLAVYARLVRGRPDDAVDGRAYSVLELAVPALEIHLTAFSNFTASANIWSNRFRFVVLNWFLGKRRSPETLMFDGERSRSRGYKPDVAEKARADGVTYVPWLTFAIHGCDPTAADRNEFPLFHRTDLREWVADPDQDVVVVDGDFYVNMAGCRPQGTGANPEVVQIQILQSVFACDLSMLWGRLNSDWLDNPQTRERWAPFQWVVAHGTFDDLERTSERQDGYCRAHGQFIELKEELTSRWISESELERLASESIQEMYERVPIEVEDPSGDLVDATRHDGGKIEFEIEFDTSSVLAFLDKAATIQARQKSIEPAKPYGRLLRLIFALDPEAVGQAAAELFSNRRTIRIPILRLLPRTVQGELVVSLEWIKNKYEISLDTVKRRLDDNDLTPIERFRPASIFRDTYEEHRRIFKLRSELPPG